MARNPAYRLRIYKPAPNESQVLVPPAGAPHSEAFQVATISGLAGYRDWLMLPTGRRQKLDPLTCRVDTGERTYEIGDVRVGGPGSDATKVWLTAFGDLKGLKVIEEERDVAGAWVAAFTGRVEGDAKSSRVRRALTVRDTSDELSKLQLFTGRPHSSIAYAVYPQLSPIGVTAAYGDIPAAGVWTGTFRTGGGSLRNFVSLSAASANAVANIISDALEALLTGPNVPFSGNVDDATGGSLRGLRCRLKRLDTQAAGEFGVLGDVDVVLRLPRDDGHHKLFRVTLAELPTNFPERLAYPPDNTAVEISLRHAAGAPTADAPLLLNDVDPAQLFQDILDGKFSALHPDGTVATTLPYDSAQLTALKGTVPTERFAIAKDENAHAWVERYLWKPHRWAHRLLGDGKIYPISLSLPQSLAGLPTITQVDLREGALSQWRTARSGAYNVLEFTIYSERPLNVETDIRWLSEAFPRVPPGGFVTQAHSVGDTPRRVNAPPKPFVIDGLGYRYQPFELSQGRDRKSVLVQRAHGINLELINQYGLGPQETLIPAQRSSVVDGLQVGAWALCQLPDLPDVTSTYQLGGTRLVQVTEKSPSAGLNVDLRVVDAGIAVFASVPTLGAPAQEAGNTRHGVTAAVTVNGTSQPVRLELAVTDTSVGTRPAEASPLWTFAARLTATQTATVRGLPSGTRIWPRLRTEADGPLQLPSAWVFPGSGPGYVDTAAITAPSVSASGATASTIDLTITTGDADLPIDLLYVTPSSGTPAYVQTLPAGTTRHVLRNLAQNTSHKVQVRHPDGLGGFSAVGETTFNTNTTLPTSSGPPKVQLLNGIP